MTPKKIAAITAIVLGSMVMTISCEENNDKPSNSSGSNPVGTRIINYTFDGSEGGSITLDVALRWFGNHTVKNISVKSHFFGATVLKKILATSNAVGIRIYYSVDDAGNKQLLLTGADNHGNDLSTNSGAKGISTSLDLGGDGVSDSFTGTEESWVSQDDSKRWMANYSTQYPQGLIAHFFGFQIINQILNETDCIGLRMYYALNDSGVQQILLVGVDSKGQNILPASLTGGKVMDGGNTVADMSYPCPTYCSGGGG